MILQKRRACKSDLRQGYPVSYEGYENEMDLKRVCIDDDGRRKGSNTAGAYLKHPSCPQRVGGGDKNGLATFIDSLLPDVVALKEVESARRQSLSFRWIKTTCGEKACIPTNKKWMLYLPIQRHLKKSSFQSLSNRVGCFTLLTLQRAKK